MLCWILTHASFSTLCSLSSSYCMRLVWALLREVILPWVSLFCYKGIVNLALRLSLGSYSPLSQWSLYTDSHTVFFLFLTQTSKLWHPGPNFSPQFPSVRFPFPLAPCLIVPSGCQLKEEAYLWVLCRSDKLGLYLIPHHHGAFPECIGILERSSSDY